MVVSAEEYRHKIFGVIPSPDHGTIFCETDMAAATASPEPKGTLTPPGSSPLRAECDPNRGSTHGSTPPSPEAPPTPDSAHMAAEPTNHNAARLHSTIERPETHLVSPDSHLLTNQEPLLGAKKRKATKVHKIETECGSEGESEAGVAGSFACPVCQEVHSSQHEFTQHIRKHNHVLETDNGTKVYCCGICKKQLSSNSSLDRHMLVHSGERPFRCHICGTHFTTNGNMHRHIRGHYRNGGSGGGGPGSDTGESDLGSEESSSSPCKRRLDDEDNVVSSKTVRLGEAEEELACPACGVEQPSQHVLEQHVENIHPEYQVACTTCQVGFKNYRALHLHNSMVHPTATVSPPQLDLTLTDFSTSKFPLIAKEICEASSRQQQHPGEGIGVHRCQMCNITFPCADSWLMHMREHAAASSALPPPFRCLRCDLTFSNLAELAHHHQLCEEPQPRKESFLAVLDLLNKQKRDVTSTPVGATMETSFLGGLRPPLGMPPPGQHSPAPADSAKASPEHPTAGRIAATTTTTSSVSPLVSTAPVLSHDEQFAREYRDMKLNGQYPCRLCKEIFANLRKLKSHNLVHMVAPPYRCNLCSFFSNDKNTLKEHMKSHKGDTPYECNLCNLAFTTKANCERHIKNIHGRQSRDEVKSCMNFIPQEEGASSDHSLDTVCHVCHIDCKARSVLRDHIRSSHPEGMTKPYSCKICGGAFSSENDVMRHVIQQHAEAASGPTLEQLVVNRSSLEDRHEHPDLTPVESLLNFSKLPMAMPLSTPHQPPPVSLPIAFPHKPSLPMSMVPPRPLTPTITPVPPLLSDTEDAPLDLSMNSKRDKEREEEEEEEDVDVEISDIKTEQIEPEDLSKPRLKKEDEATVEKTVESLQESASDVLKIPRPPFPLSTMYPQPLSLCSPFTSSQYPILMDPYGIRPVHQFDSALLEEYQKELKRGLQLTSGGALLSGAGGFLHHTSPSFPLSALALAAARRNPLRIPRPEIRSVESKADEPPVVDNLATSVSKPSDEDVMHFTMRNSVLMKKPKQRRYRTERPWRCDLCDKGFTLRSNMERHMKQQHPDVWQQRPRGISASRSESDTPASAADAQHTISDTVREQLINKIEKESNEERIEIRQREEDESELVIDDVPEEDGEDEEEDEDEEDEDIDGNSTDERSREDCGADLASVHKLLSTASSQSFPFFGSEGEEEPPGEEDSTSSTPMSEDGKRSAYSSAPQKQKCPFCQRKFPWSSSLVRHIRTHTGQKPYLCPVCHFPFTTKSNCDRHLLRKHPDSPHTTGGDRPYRCVKCPGAAFTNLESLRKHEMFKHEKASDTAVLRDDTRPFRCHVCETPLATREAALHHLGKAHPEHAQSIINTEPITTDNNNEPPVPDSTTTDRVSCMFCLQRYWSLAELKQHITTDHVRPSSPVTSEDEHKDGCVTSPIIKTEIKEERKDETEGTDFISNLLGTKRAVVDRLLTSKSADDAAKLLGVR